MRAAILLAGAALLLPGSVHAAEKWDYQSCDGYSAPTSNGDGILSGSFLFGMASQVADFTKATNSKLGAYGLAACERALADTKKLKPKFTLRRANLIQAKAVHLAAMKRYEEALATLGEVDAMAGEFDAAYYDIGLGLGNRVIRAYIFGETGRMEEARTEIAAIRAKRSYSTNIQILADKLEVRQALELPGFLTQIEERAAIDPGSVIMGFVYSLEYGLVPDAVRLGAGIQLDKPRTRGRWTISGDEFSEYEQIGAEAELAGSYAYSLAATGNVEGARAKLAEARQQLEDAKAPPPPPKPGKKQKEAVILDYETRVTHADKGLATIALWERLIDLRIEAPTLASEAFLERLLKFNPSDVGVAVDLFGIAPLGAAEEPFRAEQVAKLRTAADRRRIKLMEADLESIFKLLPRPESDKNKMRFSRSGDGYFLTDSGYSRREMDTPDDWTVRATDHAASTPTLEEAAILSAALLAKEKGYDHVLLQSRRVLQRQTHYSGMYSGNYTENSGREAQLRVRLVNAGAVPADLAGTEWRMLEVEKVIADLGPRFSD